MENNRCFVHKLLLICATILIFCMQCSFAFAADVVSVSTGNNHTGFVLSDGTLWMCGANDVGQLGDGTTENRCPPVKTMTGVKAVSAGVDITAIIKTDGSLWTCGEYKFGSIGVGDQSSDTISTPIKIATDVKAVSAGKLKTAILKNDGSLWMCGNN